MSNGKVRDRPLTIRERAEKFRHLRYTTVYNIGKISEVTNCVTGGYRKCLLTRIKSIECLVDGQFWIAADKI